MCSPIFRGIFLTPLLSYSLLTPKFNDTFILKFEFILKTKNIICVSEVDLYINNNSANNKDCLMEHWC